MCTSVRLALLAVLAAIAVPVSSFATILTFETIPAYVPGVYGSHAASIVAAGLVDEGAGFTPHIGVSYRVVDPADGSTNVAAKMWVYSTFGPLTSAADNGWNGYLGEIAFTPDPGWAVVLNGFDLAWYPFTEPNQIVRVLDDARGILWDRSPFEGTTGRVFSFTPQVASTGIIRLQFGSRNLAIDNVSFNEVPASSLPVPEPGSTLLLFGMGLIGLRALRKRLG